MKLMHIFQRNSIGVLYRNDVRDEIAKRINSLIAAENFHFNPNDRTLYIGVVGDKGIFLIRNGRRL